MSLPGDLSCIHDQIGLFRVDSTRSRFVIASHMRTSSHVDVNSNSARALEMAQQTTKNRQRTARCQARHRWTMLGLAPATRGATRRFRAARTIAGRRVRSATNRAPAASRGSTGDRSSTCTRPVETGARAAAAPATASREAPSDPRVKRSTFRASGLRYAARADVGIAREVSCIGEERRRKPRAESLAGQTPPARTDGARPGPARDLEHRGHLGVGQPIGQEMKVVEPQADRRCRGGARRGASRRAAAHGSGTECGRRAESPSEIDAASRKMSSGDSRSANGAGLAIFQWRSHAYRRPVRSDRTCSRWCVTKSPLCISAGRYPAEASTSPARLASAERTRRSVSSRGRSQGSG